MHEDKVFGQAEGGTGKVAFLVSPLAQVKERFD